MTTRRYMRSGLLAIAPSALFELMAGEEPPKREVKSAGPDVSVIEIVGPLEHHADKYCASYDEVRALVAQACSLPASIIVLKIDSPGGQVLGCFDTAREIRAACAASGKRLVAYVDGMACSAAYALACAASEIVIPVAGFAGSIGIIEARVDVAKADAAYGTRFAIVTSGARKADGNAHVAITDAELAETQARVDSLAQVFFELVAEMRPGLTVAKAAGLEARILHGTHAVQAGLADRVLSFDELLAFLAAGPEAIMGYKEARAALEEVAKGDGDEAKKAKAALAAMDGGDEEKPDADAAADEPDGDEEKPDADAAVSASSAAALGATVSKLSAEVAELKRGNEKSERAALLASRPDLSADLVKALEGMSLKDARAILAATPKANAPKLAATAVVASTVGAGQPGTGALAPSANHELDVRMGIVPLAPRSEIVGNVQTFGVMAPKKVEGTK